jgi:hypothetical protein
VGNLSANRAPPAYPLYIDDKALFLQGFFMPKISQ